MQLDVLNDTELWNVAQSTLSQRAGRQIRLKRSVPRQRIEYLIQVPEPPMPQEEYLTSTQSDTRSRLHLWVYKNWTLVNSQLPCSGALRGQCTIYPCPEGRHFACYAAALPHLKL